MLHIPLAMNRRILVSMYAYVSMGLYKNFTSFNSAFAVITLTFLELLVSSLLTEWVLFLAFRRDPLKYFILRIIKKIFSSLSTSFSPCVQSA